MPPPSFSQLRIAEPFTVEFRPVDSDGVAAIVTGQVWTAAGSNINVTNGDGTNRALVTGVAPGSDSIQVASTNSIGSATNKVQTVGVLDATTARFSIEANTRIDEIVQCVAIPSDSRTDETPSGTYSVTSITWSSASGNVYFSATPGGAGTSTLTATLTAYLIPHASGNDTINLQFTSPGLVVVNVTLAVKVRPAASSTIVIL